MDPDSSSNLMAISKSSFKHRRPWNLQILFRPNLVVEQYAQKQVNAAIVSLFKGSYHVHVQHLLAKKNGRNTHFLGQRDCLGIAYTYKQVSYYLRNSL